MAHSHTHDLDEHVAVVDPRTKRLLHGAVAACALVAVVGLVVLWPRGDAATNEEFGIFSEQVDATVVDLETGPCSFNPDDRCEQVTYEVTSGPTAGDTPTIERPIFDAAISLHRGDDVVLNFVPDATVEEARYQFADFQRRTPMLLLALLFGAAVVALGRWRGLLALVGLVVSMVVVLAFILPALLEGRSPVPVALVGATVIALASLYLAHGLHERTSVAFLATFASLLVTFVLAQLFSGAAHITGLANEEAGTLLAFAPELDFRGLVLAAIIIGTLGVLDDVTVTQVSAVWELHLANSRMGPARLYAAAIRIGRDHIASTVNTLVLAYTAAALPLLLLYTQGGLQWGRVATSETVAVEIIQTLVGSIGLVASVPIATALAVVVVTREPAWRARPAGVAASTTPG
ncbi:MAG: YibE/F family protein [Acidimicrobiales bacterium]